MLTLGVAATLSTVTAQGAARKRPNSKEAQPNAAVLYRQAIAEMNKAIADPKTGESTLPDGYYVDPKVFLTEEWATIISKCAVALTLFAQGTQIKKCQFDDKPDRYEIELGITGRVDGYSNLMQVQRAQGWQLVQSDPIGACTAAFRMLDFSSHCAQNLTSDGSLLHIFVDKMAAELLRAGIAKLHGPDSKATATKFLAKLEQVLKQRMTPRDIAASAEEGVRQLVFHDPETQKNPAFEQAAKRAMELTRELLQPLRDKPGITSAEFEDYGAKKQQALHKLTLNIDYNEVIKTGSGDVLAACLISMFVSDFPRLLVGSAERSQQLEACREQLRKLASKSNRE